MAPNPIRRKRVAYHEAAHAVVARSQGFYVNMTFLTAATTDDGEMGGYTGWNNPLAPHHAPAPSAVSQYARAVCLVLYAGQTAERILAERDSSVHLPDVEPNWALDDSEAAAVMALPGFALVQATEGALREEARREVTRLWHVIAFVAAVLEEPADAGASVGGPFPPAGRLLRDADIADYLRPLVQRMPPEFERDDVVLRHEAGHIVSWFIFGGGIGPLRLLRREDGKLVGGVLFGPPSAKQTEDAAFIDACAERLVAGELAARGYLGLPDWQLSSGDDYASLHTATRHVSVVRERLDPTLIDARKVLDLAEDHHPQAWWSWLQERLLVTSSVLRAHEPKVAALAECLRSGVPTKQGESERLTSGTDVVRWGYEVGLQPALSTRPPVELVPADFSGGVHSWARRLWRTFGRNATSYRRTPAAYRDRK